MTLFDALNGLYEKYGYYLEANQELYMEGIDGKEKMAKLMDTLRNNAPKEIAGNKIVEIGDYLKATITNRVNNSVESTNLPSSNVISFKMENNDVIIARPSGTEPKIKFYYLLSGTSKDEMTIKLNEYKAFVNQFV
jgi:phosphoglucomutase